MKEESILFKIKDLDKVIFRNFFAGVKIEKEKFNKFKNFSPTQMQIIRYILNNPKKEIFQKDLEDVLKLRRATVSGVLQTMEKNGLIERVIDINDTRTKKIILNPETRKAFLKSKEKTDNLEKIMIKNISKDDLETFSRVIDIMKNNIENAEKDI